MSPGTAGYSGTPLPKKLGIRPGTAVALVGAPATFRDTLGPLPDGARLLAGASPRAGITVWFVRRRADFLRALPGMTEAAARGPLWVSWPKKTSPLSLDLSETIIREHGLAAGLVDYKVCAIDADWSGLAFRVRKTPR